MRTHPPLLAPLVFGVAGTIAAGEQIARMCPGNFDVQGIGSVSLVPTGWATPENMTYPVVGNGTINTTLNSRSYFAAECTPGVYDNSQYLALDLRNKTLTYTTDLSSTGCGCNAALYLTSMRQNENVSECSDYYCDANNVCGESCAEIDIQEANLFSWHSTLHESTDHGGLGKGYGGGNKGWSGPRDFGAAEFGPDGKCVDTNAPFQVSVHFRTDGQLKLQAMEITLSQHGHDCPLWLSLDEYGGMGELDAALAAGMTPIVSYWSSEDMLWMDGKGADGEGPCLEDKPKDCGESVLFYNFSVMPAFPATTTSPKPSSSPAPEPRQPSAAPTRQPSAAPARQPSAVPARQPSAAPARQPSAAPAAGQPAPLQSDRKTKQAFIVWLLAMLAASTIVAVPVWIAMASRTRRGQGVCDGVSAKPLQRAVQGSAQCLLVLAESGEGGPSAGQQATAAQQPPSRESTSSAI